MVLGARQEIIKISSIIRKFEEILERTVEDFCDLKSLSAEKLS